MNVVKVELPRTLETVYIDVLSDLHLADKDCNLPEVKRRIERIKNNENYYTILNGDLLNMATKHSKSDVYSSLSPMEEISQLIALLEPIKHKILCATTGNHESRAYKEVGVGVMNLIMSQLGLLDKYDPVSNLLFIRFGSISKKESKGTGEKRRILYTLYHQHGSGGGGRRVGSKANALEDTSAWIDSDIIVRSHTHQPLGFKTSKYIIDERNSTVYSKDILHVNTSATLDYSGSYGEALGYKPSSQHNPVIILNGTKKEASVIL